MEATPVARTPSAADYEARIAALEGDVSTLVDLMEKMATMFPPLIEELRKVRRTPPA